MRIYSASVESLTSANSEKMKLPANRLLFIPAVTLLVVVWALSGSCAPTEPMLQRNVYRILSDNSGKHVGVTRGGRVHAHANRPSKFDITTFNKLMIIMTLFL